MQQRALQTSADEDTDSDDAAGKDTNQKSFQKASAGHDTATGGQGGESAPFTIDYGGVERHPDFTADEPLCAPVDHNNKWARSIFDALHPSVGEVWAAPTHFIKDDENQKWTYADYNTVSAGARSLGYTPDLVSSAAYAQAN